MNFSPPTITAAKTLAVAALGGCVFHWAGIPLAWMLGAMWATLLFAAVGGRPEMPRLCRRVSLAVIGCYLGAEIGPDILNFSAADGAAIFIATAAATVGATFAAAFVVRRLVKTDADTAVLAAAPGGLSFLFAMADERRADHGIIGALHTVRILAVATLTPLWARFIVAPPTADATAAAEIMPFGIAAAALFALAFAAGMGAGRLFRGSQFFLLTPLFAVGAAYAAGASGAPPREGLYAAQALLGASLGSRFGAARKNLGRLGIIGAVLAGFHMLFAAAAAMLLSAWGDYSFAVSLLALAPGGIAEICLTAELLDLRPGVVAAAQIWRLLLLFMLTPLMMKIFRAGARQN